MKRNYRLLFACEAGARGIGEMASGSSVDKSSIDRRLFQQAYISPLEAVRDFFEVLSELRAASAPSDIDTDNARYMHNLCVDEYRRDFDPCLCVIWHEVLM